MEIRYYKKINGQKLRLHLFYPEKYDKNRKQSYPAALSIHGGAWTEGPIEWGHDDAQYLAELGLIGIAVEYRLADYKQVTVIDCMKDVNSAIRWVRKYAHELNINPEQIMAIGHSAGGHLAIASALLPHFKEPTESVRISSIPDLVWALAPAVALKDDLYLKKLLLDQESPVNCSPFDNIKKISSPVFMIHGSNDEILPVQYSKDFVAKMKAVGNQIGFWEYANGNHNFFYQDISGKNFYHKKIKESLEQVNWIN